MTMVMTIIIKLLSLHCVRLYINYTVNQNLHKTLRKNDVYSAQLRPGSGTDKINFIHCLHFM